MTNIKKIVFKLINDELDWSEKKALSKKRPVEMMMKKEWDETRYNDMPELLTESIWNKIEQKTNRPKVHFMKRRATILSMAASIAILVGSFLLFNLLNVGNDIKQIKVFTQTHLMYTLPDNSKVWLNKGDTIIYTNEFGQGERKIIVKGEAFFDVTKNKKSPFIVCFDKSAVKVYGTSFLVNNKKKNSSEVTLYSGSVEFIPENSRDRVMMKPKEKIVYNKIDGTIAKLSASDVTWDDGKYLFQDLRLDSLVSFINNRYNTQIKLEGNIDLSNKMNGCIQFDESIESVVSKLCFNLGTKYKKENNSIIIHN